MSCLTIQNAANLSFWAGEYVESLPESENLGRKIGGRLLHAAQVITSLVAIPLILLLGLSFAGFHALKGEGTSAKRDLIDAGSLTLGHALFMIPVSVVGIWKNNKEAQESAVKTLERFYAKVEDVFTNTFSCLTGKVAVDKE